MSTPDDRRTHRRRKRKLKPSPFERFPENEERLIEAVENALPAGTEFPTWTKGGKNRKPQRLQFADLAVGLYAVETVGTARNGLSYYLLDKCFKECRGVGCHNNKASAIFKTLTEWKLIAKVANYSVGRKGNSYAVIKDGKPVFTPTVYAPMTPSEPTTPRKDLNDVPW